jgi:hypothetical protein
MAKNKTTKKNVQFLLVEKNLCKKQQKNTQLLKYKKEKEL